MLGKVFFCVLIVNCHFYNHVNALMNLDMDSDRFPLDRRVLEAALDPELCQRQLNHLTVDNRLLLARFLDAGTRIPRSILMGNTIDLGNFHQCLAINEEAEDMTISGKYCRIQVPINQNLHLPNSKRPNWNFDPSDLHLDENVSRRLEGVNLLKTALKSGLPGPDKIERIAPNSLAANLSFSMAICIPRPCTTQEVINGLLFNLTSIGFEYNDISCRLPDDRPWVTADYIAIVVFSTIGFLTLISTSYDFYQTMHLKRGEKEISKLYSSFSVYTNTRRLLTFNSSPGTLECLDGIRVLAILWVILGHSFFTVTDTINPIDTIMWSISTQAIWVTVAPLTVDTFFFLSGLLLVYTTVGKIGRMQLLKNLPVFYLHRLLRMFPILAAVILFESSFYMRVSDGPMWDRVAYQAYKCREFWWSTLLHLQNIVNPIEACIGVTWYLAIDVQLHILSPLILFWVLASKRAAWTAINASLLATLTASTVYIFFRNFPSGIISPNRQADMEDFFIYYYANILTRASPFLVGMLYGYLIHLSKKNKAYIPRSLTTVLFLLSLLLLLVIMYCSQIAMTLEWDNQLADNFFNSFLRPLWALGLGWIIFACVQGVAEPLNWFLSLRMWKLPARISYAMYLTHFSIMVVYYATPIAPIYFTVSSIVMNFLVFLTATLILSFFVTLLIDSPFATIFKIILGSPKKPKEPETTIEGDNPEKESRNEIVNNGFISDEDTRIKRVLESKPVDDDFKLHINGDTDKTLL